MKEIIAMHGWAGDGNQWSNWIELFQSDEWVWQSAERGYRDAKDYMPTWRDISNQNNNIRVVICHSLGAHMMYTKTLSLATHIVFINSFSRFIPSGKENRSVKMGLKKMINAINTPNEIAMLKKFYIKAFKPNQLNLDSIESNLFYISDAGRLKLKNDLTLLMNCNSLPTGLHTLANVLVINSEQDYILANQTKIKLAEDLTKHLKYEPKIVNLKEEGHFIVKVKHIKKIKQWLESDHAKNMVQPSK